MAAKIRIPTDEATLFDRLVVSYARVLMSDAVARSILESGQQSLIDTVMDRAILMAETHVRKREERDEELAAAAKAEREKEKAKKDRQ